MISETVGRDVAATRPGAFSSIMLLDHEGQWLRQGVAPNLPGF
jgi:hypothetical protein